MQARTYRGPAYAKVKAIGSKPCSLLMCLPNYIKNGKDMITQFKEGALVEDCDVCEQIEEWVKKMTYSFSITSLQIVKGKSSCKEPVKLLNKIEYVTCDNNLRAGTYYTYKTGQLEYFLSPLTAVMMSDGNPVTSLPLFVVGHEGSKIEYCRGYWCLCIAVLNDSRIVCPSPLLYERGPTMESFNEFVRSISNNYIDMTCEHTPGGARIYVTSCDSDRCLLDASFPLLAVNIVDNVVSIAMPAEKYWATSISLLADKFSYTPCTVPEELSDIHFGLKSKMIREDDLVVEAVMNIIPYSFSNK